MLLLVYRKSEPIFFNTFARVQQEKKTRSFLRGNSVGGCTVSLEYRGKVGELTPIFAPFSINSFLYYGSRKGARSVLLGWSGCNKKKTRSFLRRIFIAGPAKSVFRAGCTISLEYRGETGEPIPVFTLFQSICFLTAVAAKVSALLWYTLVP